MNNQLFIDRILESENLTDELEDAEAKWLINWGIDRLSEILSSPTDEEVASGKVSALMAVIRKMNQIAGRPSPVELEVLVSDLANLGNLCKNVFDLVQKPKDISCLAAAKQMNNFSTAREKLLFLTRWGYTPFENL